VNGLGLLAVLAPVVVAFLASLAEHADRFNQQKEGNR
jgi:hypothetical protein